MATMRAFCFREAAKLAFLAAVEPSNALFERSSLCAFIVQTHFEFHVPVPSMLKSIKLLVYALVRSTEFPFQALNFRDV
jgi:hypothetical protein